MSLTEDSQIRAKSVLLRDLNLIKAQNNPSDESQSLAQPPAVESQSKYPVAIEIDSSPQAALKEEPADDHGLGSKSGGAPIPDMGMGIGLDMGISDSIQPPVPVKQENVPSQTPATGPDGGSDAVKAESKETASEAPMAGMDITLEGTQADMGGADDAVMDLSNTDLNFTDMEFTLAPVNDNQSQQGVDGNAAVKSTEPSFDLTSFDTTDNTTGNMAVNMSSLDNMLPNQITEQPTSTTNAPETAAAAESQRNTEVEKKEQMADAALTDVFTGDGQADGMDFDFSLGDGMGGDTFDDLMNDRDNTFDTMEHGEFDANFFGLDKIDDA
jgi:hypothetical protein